MIFEETPPRGSAASTSTAWVTDADEASPSSATHPTQQVRFADFLAGQHPPSPGASNGERVVFDSKASTAAVSSVFTPQPHARMPTPSNSSNVRLTHQAVTPRLVELSRIEREDGSSPGLARQRAALHQIATELRERQQSLAYREMEVEKREALLEQRSKDLDAAYAQLTAQREAAARTDNPKSLELEEATSSCEAYRTQLRNLNKELNAKETELDDMAVEMMRERERIAKQKMDLDAREAALQAEQDEISLDVRRHAEKLQQTSRLVESKLEEAERKARDAENLRYEWDLKTVDLQIREAALRKREADLQERERRAAAAADAARSLERHVVQVRRVAERVTAREQALWETAAKAAAPSNGLRAVAAIKEDLRSAKSTLEALSCQLPSMAALSAV